MIDTAIEIVSKGAVEHAKDVAQERLEDLSERLAEIDIPPLPQLAQLTKPKKKKARHRTRWTLLLLTALGIGAVVVIARRRMSQGFDDVAPDAFGSAVNEERAAGTLGQRPIATPGA
jgi:ferric-dicitrate binding protein FerR (iron transport regulator)